MSGARLWIVTGKGGVGKTTVAAALAHAASAEGETVLVVEVAKPGRLASALDVSPLASTPSEVRPGVWAAAPDEEDSLTRLIEGLLPLRLLSRRLLASDSFQAICAAIPGITEAALLARLLGWLEHDDRTLPAFDRVILDAPASGQSLPLLATPDALLRMVNVGPLGELLRRCRRQLTDPERTRALVVALPEDWAVAEAIELRERLREETAVALARPVLNGVVTRRFSRAEEEKLATAQSEGRVDPTMLAAAQWFRERRDNDVAFTRRLREGTGERPLELPRLFTSRLGWNEIGTLSAPLAREFVHG